MVLCAGAFGCYAAQGSLPGAQGQGYDLNLSYSRTTLKAVADAITQQVGIAFSYETALAGYPMENLEVSEKGATIEAILAAVFTPRGIDYRVVDKVVVLTRSTRPVPAASAAAKASPAPDAAPATTDLQTLDSSPAAVEAAVQAAEGSEQTQGLISSSVVIPSPHMDIVRALM